MGGASDSWNPVKDLWDTITTTYDDLSGEGPKRRKEQALLDRQEALDKKRYDFTLRTSAEQRDLAITNENIKFQTDDQAQIDAISKAINDGSMSLDQKLALIDSQVKAGLGTESTKLALNAKILAQQEFDLNGVGGARDIQQRQMEQGITGATNNILSMTQQRDAGIAEGVNANTALGLSGTGTDRQVSAAEYGANQQIQSQAVGAGFFLNEDTNSLTSGSVFDQALQKSLSGQNLGRDAFNANVRANQTQFEVSQQSFANDVFGLGAADTAYRASTDLSYRSNVEGAALNLEGSQINTDAQQYKIDETSNLTMNFLLGVSQVALWASNPAVGAAASGAMKWWGSMQTPAAQTTGYSNPTGAPFG